MRRLICTFVVRICHKQVFSWRGSNTKQPKRTTHKTALSQKIEQGKDTKLILLQIILWRRRLCFPLKALRPVGTQERSRIKAYIQMVCTGCFLFLVEPTHVQLTDSHFSSIQVLGGHYANRTFHVFLQYSSIRGPLWEPNLLCIFCIKKYIGTQCEDLSTVKVL